MKERPILFSGEMVRATLDDRKTQTRRVIKPQPEWLGSCTFGRSLKPFANEEEEGPTDYDQWFQMDNDNNEWNPIGKCPYGVPGDQLWVRETWAQHPEDPSILYRANRGGDLQRAAQGDFKWKPSIHMPRWASRILLEITDIRVEQVREISDADCYAEGLTDCSRGCKGAGCVAGEIVECYDSMPEVFSYLWDSINLKRGYGWDRNPWVWVISFRRIDEPTR